MNMFSPQPDTTWGSNRAILLWKGEIERSAGRSVGPKLSPKRSLTFLIITIYQFPPPPYQTSHRSEPVINAGAWNWKPLNILKCSCYFSMSTFVLSDMCRSDHVAYLFVVAFSWLHLKLQNEWLGKVFHWELSKISKTRISPGKWNTRTYLRYKNLR